MVPQPLEVDVVHEGASLLGPTLIAIGGVAAAALTAGLTVITANRRHRVQLEQDRILQEAQLDHDRQVRGQQLQHDQEALLNQLQHDREMRHRENVQRFLDSAVERERQFRYSVEDFARKMLRAENWRSDLESSEYAASDPDWAKGEIAERREQLMELQNRTLDLHSDRLDDSVLLTVRMGGHEVAKCHGDAVNSIGEMLSCIGVGLSGDWGLRTPEQKRNEKEAAEKVTSTQAAFLQACKRWYAPRRPEPADDDIRAGNRDRGSVN